MIKSKNWLASIIVCDTDKPSVFDFIATITGQVENYLQDVLNCQRKTLGNILRRSLKRYPNQARVEWLMDADPPGSISKTDPAQVEHNIVRTLAKATPTKRMVLSCYQQRWPESTAVWLKELPRTTVPLLSPGRLLSLWLVSTMFWRSKLPWTGWTQEITPPSRGTTTFK